MHLLYQNLWWLTFPHFSTLMEWTELVSSLLRRWQGEVWLDSVLEVFPTWMFLWPGAVISQELSQTALRVHWQQGKRFPTLSVMGSIHSSKDSCPCLSQWHQGSEFMSHQYSWLTHQAQGSESMSHQHFWLTSLSKCLSATQVQRKNPSWARWSCCSNSTLIITSNY